MATWSSVRSLIFLLIGVTPIPATSLPDSNFQPQSLALCQLHKRHLSGELRLEGSLHLLVSPLSQSSSIYSFRRIAVQNLIERCLQLYMNQKEVIDTLSIQAKIEPSFTQLVWQKLEEENREFFEAYHVRLIVKNQIMVFNKLLEKQVEMMQTACPSGVSRMPLPNGSNSSSNILENYDRSPYLPHDSNNFSDSPGREFKEEDIKKLDTISEGVSYEDFGSD